MKKNGLKMLSMGTEDSWEVRDRTNCSAIKDSFRLRVLTKE